MTTLIISVPMPPNLTNRGSGKSHWRTIHREKRQYATLLDGFQAARRIPGPPSTPIGAATLAVVMHLGARMDYDNAAARCKWPIDWLASRGYLRNDRLLTWLGMPEQVIQRGGDYRIVFTITPQEKS